MFRLFYSSQLRRCCIIIIFKKQMQSHRFCRLLELPLFSASNLVVDNRFTCATQTEKFLPKKFVQSKRKIYFFKSIFFFDFLPNKKISYTYPKSNRFSKRKNYLYLPEKKQTILWINEINSYTCPNKLSFRKKKILTLFQKTI